jgi:hypothetical protein
MHIADGASQVQITFDTPLASNNYMMTVFLGWLADGGVGQWSISPDTQTAQGFTIALNKSPFGGFASNYLNWSAAMT